MAAGVAFIISNSMLFQSIFEFNSYSKTMVDLSIITLSLIYFYWVMVSDKIVQISKAVDLFVVSVFLNASASILIHLFSNQMLKLNLELFDILVGIRAAINIVTQVIIVLGLYNIYRKQNNLVVKQIVN